MRLAWLALLAVVLAGCKSRILPDPNDPADVGKMSTDTVRKNLNWANAMLVEREALGQITPDQSRDLIAKRAKELIDALDTANVPDAKTWEYAEILMTAKRYAEAEPVLEKAVKVAANDDRRVNDSLRLAQVEARLGKVAKALTTARSVFGAPDNELAPILPAVYLEIAPVAKGKGSDTALADLLVDAAKLHYKAKVDESTPAGKSFVLARFHHASHALLLAASLYESGGESMKAYDARNLMGSLQRAGLPEKGPQI